MSVVIAQISVIADCFDLLLQQYDIVLVAFVCDKEVEVDASHKTFGVIGVRVAPSVVHILLSHIEVEVDDLEWVVTRMKAESAAELPSKASGIFLHIYSFYTFLMIYHQYYLMIIEGIRRSFTNYMSLWSGTDLCPLLL